MDFTIGIDELNLPSNVLKVYIDYLKEFAQNLPEYYTVDELSVEFILLDGNEYPLMVINERLCEGEILYYSNGTLENYYGNYRVEIIRINDKNYLASSNQGLDLGTVHFDFYSLNNGVLEESLPKISDYYYFYDIYDGHCSIMYPHSYDEYELPVENYKYQELKELGSKTYRMHYEENKHLLYAFKLTGDINSTLPELNMQVCQTLRLISWDQSYVSSVNFFEVVDALEKML